MEILEIGKFIKATRESKKISRNELADKLGISVPTITSLENGGNTGINVLNAVCNELDLVLDIRVRINEN
jgi:transcriptional regulator with XRE-family HTH domain